MGIAIRGTVILDLYYYCSAPPRQAPPRHDLTSPHSFCFQKTSWQLQGRAEQSRAGQVQNRAGQEHLLSDLLSNIDPTIFQTFKAPMLPHGLELRSLPS